MDEKELEQFDPTVAELQKMVEATRDIKATDLEDAKQLTIVKENRISLKNARVRIEKTGKALRENALKFQKAVIAKEKELVAIIEPEEDRLAAIEEEAKKLVVRKVRLQKLPQLKERIESAGLSQFATKSDDELLELDDNGFEAYFNVLGASKIQHDAETVDAEARKLREEKEKLEREKEIRAAEERAKVETEARIKKETEEKAEKERIEAAKKEEEKAREEAALAKRKEYIDFLASHGYTKETADDFHMIETDEGYVLYKKVGVFKK